MTSRQEDREIQQELAAQLQGDDPVAQLEAAERLLVRAREQESLVFATSALVATLDAADRRLRTTAARALLVPSLASLSEALPVVEELLGSDDGGLQERAAEALVLAARNRFDRPAMANAFLPFLIAAFGDTEEPAERAFLLELLETCGSLGADLSAGLAGITSSLADPDAHIAYLAAEALGNLVSQGVDIGAAVPGLEAGLSRGSGKSRPDVGDVTLQYACASTLACVAVVQGDRSLADRLASHGGEAVREGAARGFGPPDHPGFSSVVTALGTVISAEVGGALFYALRNLDQAVQHGVDVSAAVPALKQRLGTRAYSRDDWALGMDMDWDELRRESPSRDAATVLARHFVAQRDRGELEALLGHAQERVQQSVRRTLRAMIDDVDDEGRRWIADVDDADS